MTDLPVSVRFRWTADELLKAHRYHFRHICRPVFRFFLHVIFALMMVAGVGGLIGGNVGIATILLTFFGVYWFAIRPIEKRWAIRRQFKRRPDRETEIEWVIGDEELQNRSTVGKSEFPWDALAKVVVTPEGLLFYPTEQIFHWLPRVGFSNDSQFRQVEELVKTKAARVYRVD